MVPPRTRVLVRGLLHPLRATLQQRIAAADKPVPLGNLARTFDLETALARYHVQRLAACGLAALDREGRVRSR
jgi:hypothetical protein